MAILTSIHNPRVKAAVKLRDHRHRARHGRILIDGVRELQRAIASGIRLLEVFVCPSLCQEERCRTLVEQVASTGAEVFEVNEPVFEKLAYGDRAEGVLGVAAEPEASLDALRLPDVPLVGVLEGVEKPGNVGAVLRTADAAGLSALIVADGGTDLFNPNAIRASLGTIFTVPVAAAPAPQAFDWLRQRQLTVYAARVDGSVPYTDVDFRRPCAIVLGSEAHGLTAAWSGPDIVAIRLPMLGIADSLNVSATAAVLFYEALRQRTSAV